MLVVSVMSLQPTAEVTTDSDRMSGTTKQDLQDNEYECDSSSFMYKRKQALVMNEQADTSSLKRVPPLVSVSGSSIKAPPIVIQKVNVSSSRVNVKPTIKTVTPTLSSRIDKIVDNLKQKQQQKPAVPPRVAPVHDRQSSKMLLHQRILMSLRRQEKENRVQSGDENDKSSNYDDDSLTSLNWLNKYNLSASTGFQPISPPPTPPLVLPHARNSYIPHSRVPLAKPVVNPLILKKTNAPASSGDESDGCSSKKYFIYNTQDYLKNTIKGHFASGESTPSLLSMVRGLDASSSSKRSTLRPPYTYSSLAFLAIESSVRKRLSVKEIYNWITDNVPYYSSVPSGSWKNSIRHNLASSDVFCKVDKNLLAMRDFSGKGSLWCINPEYRESLIENVKRCGSDFVKLAEIKLLQDVNENTSGGGSASSSSSTIGIRSSSASSLSSPNTSSRLNKTSIKFGMDQPVRINERLNHHRSLNNKNMGAAYINPNIRSLTKANNPYMKQPIYKAQINTNLAVNSGSNGKYSHKIDIKTINLSLTM